MPERPSGRRGDLDREGRFRRLFHDHYRIVMAYALRRTRVAEDAHDVASETFATAWRRLDIVPQDRDGQVAWLLATARRVLANLHRSNRRWRALQDRVRRSTTSGPARDIGDAASEVELVRRALDGLSEIDREILRLAAWEDLPHAQIAHILDVSPSAVSVRLHRARHRLADALTLLEQDSTGGDR